jgi:cell division septal protein FtsQ
LTKLKIYKHTSPTDDDYNPKKDRSFKIILFSVLGFFVGSGLCVGYYHYTLIDIFNLSKFLVLFAVLGFLLPLKYYRRWFHFVKYEMIIFNVLGMGPFLTGLLLVLNFTFTTESYTHNYKIEKVYFEGDQEFQSMGVVLENNFFSGERKIVELTDIPPNEVVGKSFLKVTISKGLFGYEVIEDKMLIK